MPDLTPRECEVLAMMDQGYEAKEIGAMFGISPRTADNIWSYARAWLQVELQSRASR